MAPSSRPPRPPPRRARTWSNALLLVLFAVGGVVGWLCRGGGDEDRVRRAPPPRRTETPATPARDAATARTPAPPDRHARSRGQDGAPVAPAPAPGAAALRQQPRSYEACLDDDAPQPALERPSLSEPLQLRASELQDHARYLVRRGDASGKLRRGVEALFRSEAQPSTVQQLLAAPERHQDGLDLGASAAIVLGAHALQRGQRRDARNLADMALREASEDALAHLLDALVAEVERDATTAVEGLRRAHELDPEEPAIALALGRRLAHRPDLGESVDALDVYLTQVPEDRAIGSLRARLARQRQMQRDYLRQSRGGLTLLWSPQAMTATRAGDMLTTLDAALDEAARLTRTRRRQALTVVAYPSREQLHRASCVQAWSGAVFDGTLRLAVDVLKQADARRRILRHESLHAQLHSRVRTAPRWFDEGLAQYFASAGEGELPASLKRSWKLMVDNETWVPFSSLQGSFQVIDGHRDAGLAYHQSLAMVELLVERRGRRAIADAVAHLAQGGEPAKLWDEVVGSEVGGRQLLRFVEGRLRRN